MSSFAAALADCMNRGIDIRKGLDYMLATGNLQSKSGLGLTQVKHSSGCECDR